MRRESIIYLFVGCTLLGCGLWLLLSALSMPNIVVAGLGFGGVLLYFSKAGLIPLMPKPSRLDVLSLRVADLESRMDKLEQELKLEVLKRLTKSKMRYRKSSES